MKNKIVILFLLIIMYAFCMPFAEEGILFINFMSPNAAYAQAGNFELGGSFGTPSGLNARYWITDRIGLDSSAGIAFNKYPVFTLDLLMDTYRLYSSVIWESRLFIGFGGLIAKEGGDIKENLRIPVGLSFPILRYPIDISCYIAPAMVINPKKEYELNWGIGIRYNFTRAAAMRTRQDDLEWQLGEIERDVEGLKHGLDTTKGKLTQTEGELSATKGKLAQTEGELSITKGKLDDMTGKLAGIKLRLDAAKGELDTTKNKLYLTTKELDDTKDQLDDVKNELNNTKKTLDDKQSELNKKQVELDKAKNIIENAFTGNEKKEEEKKLALRQKELNNQFIQLKTEKQEWEKIKEKESERRAQLIKKCEERGGIIDENGYCTCPENQEWDPKTDKCVCVKGYYRNKPDDDCKPCEIIKQSGECAGGCEDFEDKVPLKSGPHKYVCIKKCRKSNEVWSKRKKACVCRDGFYRNEAGDCVPRQ